MCQTRPRDVVGANAPGVARVKVPAPKKRPRDGGLKSVFLFHGSLRCLASEACSNPKLPAHRLNHAQATVHLVRVGR